MRIAVTGASGLIGAAFTRLARNEGHAVRRFVRVRAQADSDDVVWDPATGRIDPDALEEMDALVHLSGENIGSGVWSAQKKRRIRASRVDSTALLARALISLAHPPRVWVCASAIGLYGDRGDEVLTEESAAGAGFLADVCQAWEAAAQPARQAGLRVAHGRFGIVLSGQGGALNAMRALFRLGLGGRIGSGRQFMSWVHIGDAAGALLHILATPQLAGAVNVCAPHPITNREFTRALAAVMRRPAWLPLPAWLARLALGEKAQALLLSSARVLPRQLLDAGFSFQFPNIENALADLLTPRAGL